MISLLQSKSELSSKATSPYLTNDLCMAKQLPAIVHDMQIVGICDYSSLENKETCQYNNHDHLHGCAHAVSSDDESSVARNAKATFQ